MWQDLTLTAYSAEYRTFNDQTESMAIKKTLSDHVYKVKVTSSKSMMGYPISAAGATLSKFFV